MYIWFNTKQGRYYCGTRIEGTRRLKSSTLASHVWKTYNGQAIPKGCIIHHMNLDRTDDRIENLQMLTIAEHTRLHNRLRHIHVVVDGIPMQRCAKCKEYQPLTAYAHSRYCRPCSAAYSREHREKLSLVV